MFNQDHVADLLKTVRHFQSLAEADVRAIIRSGHVQNYPADSILFHEGDRCAGMFVLLRGAVQLRKLGPEGREQIMNVIEPVAMFNEVPAIDEGPNVATATTSEPSLVWHTACSAFQDLLKRYPEISRGLLRVLARRSRFLITQYEDLSFRTVIARTAKLLLSLSDHGRVVIDRHANPNIELAARVATVPEAFSRALGLLRSNALIRCTRDEITVCDPDGLAEIAYL